MPMSYGPFLATVIANDASKDVKEGTGVLWCCVVVAFAGWSFTILRTIEGTENPRICFMESNQPARVRTRTIE